MHKILVEVTIKGALDGYQGGSTFLEIETLFASVFRKHSRV